MQEYSKDFLIEMLENLWTVRLFEQSAGKSFIKGEISGNVHVCTGQEGAVVGANMALEPEDYIAASHRGHGHCIMKSHDVDHTMAELFGRTTGFCRGRGGSMHVTKIESGLLGANGIVGGGIPLATGSALASKIDGDNAVTVVFFGDGASNQGCFHECVNMAAAWKLPIIYFIENNEFAVSVNIKNVCNTETLAERAKGYGIPGERIDGTNVLEVYETVKKAAEWVRKGNGPMLIDCKVYRFTGHFIGDSVDYVPEEYFREAHEQDPIDKFKAYLLEQKVATAEEMDAVQQKASDRIEKARQFALASPLPDKAAVTAFNYSCDNERSVSR